MLNRISHYQLMLFVLLMPFLLYSQSRFHPDMFMGKDKCIPAIAGAFLVKDTTQNTSYLDLFEYHNNTIYLRYQNYRLDSLFPNISFENSSLGSLTNLQDPMVIFYSDQQLMQFTHDLSSNAWIRTPQIFTYPLPGRIVTMSSSRDYQEFGSWITYQDFLLYQDTSTNDYFLSRLNQLNPFDSILYRHSSANILQTFPLKNQQPSFLFSYPICMIMEDSVGIYPNLLLQLDMNDPNDSVAIDVREVSFPHLQHHGGTWERGSLHNDSLYLLEKTDSVLYIHQIAHEADSQYAVLSVPLTNPQTHIATNGSHTWYEIVPAPDSLGQWVHSTIRIRSLIHGQVIDSISLPFLVDKTAYMVFEPLIHRHDSLKQYVYSLSNVSEHRIPSGFINQGVSVNLKDQVNLIYETFLRGSIECLVKYEQFVSVHERKKTNTVKTFPNPSRDVLYIQSHTPIASIKAYNLEGKSISLPIHLKESNPHHVQLNLENLAPGIYKLVIQNESGTESHRWVKL